VNVLQEEKASVLRENMRLQDRLSQFEGSEDPDTRTIHRHQETRRQLDALRDEVFKLETCKILY